MLASSLFDLHSGRVGKTPQPPFLKIDATPDPLGEISFRLPFCIPWRRETIGGELFRAGPTTRQTAPPKPRLIGWPWLKQQPAIVRRLSKSGIADILGDKIHVDLSLMTYYVRDIA